MNKAILTGRLTKNPELKTTQSGLSVCSFTIAVNRRFKNADGNYEADFINCVAWRQQAEYLSKYFAKGRMIGIVGNIQTRFYENGGKRVYITEIIVEEVHFVDSKALSSASENKENDSTSDFAGEDTGFMPTPEDDDLPF